MHLMLHFWAIINSRFLLWLRCHSHCRHCNRRRRRLRRCRMHFICFHFRVDICLLMPCKKLCFVSLEGEVRRWWCCHMKGLSQSQASTVFGNKTKMDYVKFELNDKTDMGGSVETKWKLMQGLKITSITKGGIFYFASTLVIISEPQTTLLLCLPIMWITWLIMSKFIDTLSAPSTKVESNSITPPQCAPKNVFY